MSRTDQRAQLEGLLTKFMDKLADPAGLQRLLQDEPAALSPEFDILLVQFAAVSRQQGDVESAEIVDRYRALLDECRRIGVPGAFVKANAYAVMGGFLNAEGPDAKIAYLHAHPELDDMVNRAALYQMIDEAQQRGNADLFGFLRSNLMLLDAAFMSSPEEAVDRAFGRS